MQPLIELCQSVLEAMKKETYTEWNLKKHKNTYLDFCRFAQSKETQFFSDELMHSYFEEKYSAILQEKTGGRTQWVNSRITHIKKLKHFQEQGNVHFHTHEGQKKSSVCPKCFIPIWEDYQQFFEPFNYADNTTSKIRYESLKFFQYLDKNSIHKMTGINAQIIVDYFYLYRGTSANYLKTKALHIRKLLKYLYFESKTTEDLSYAVPIIHMFREAYMPSIVTPHEMDCIFEQIDKNKPIGKRDYALLLLAGKAGIRSCDIKNIRISDFDWKQHTLSFVQQKTHKHLCIPCSGIIML
jgi:integrase/recombinase XerD